MPFTDIFPYVAITRIDVFVKRGSCRVLSLYFFTERDDRLVIIIIIVIVVTAIAVTAIINIIVVTYNTK